MQPNLGQDPVIRDFLKGIDPVRHRIRCAVMFGSRARGTHRLDSDYDLLLVVPKKDAAQAALLTEGQRGDTHKGVVLLFGLLLVKTGKFDKKWGKFLANLKDDRETGDDDALSFIDEETARRAVSEAEEVLSRVAGYLSRLAET